jgi:hypothetical protein
VQGTCKIRARGIQSRAGVWVAAVGGRSCSHRCHHGVTPGRGPGWFGESWCPAVFDGGVQKEAVGVYERSGAVEIGISPTVKPEVAVKVSCSLLRSPTTDPTQPPGRSPAASASRNTELSSEAGYSASLFALPSHHPTQTITPLPLPPTPHIRSARLPSPW